MNVRKAVRLRIVLCFELKKVLRKVLLMGQQFTVETGFTIIFRPTIGYFPGKFSTNNNKKWNI